MIEYWVAYFGVAGSGPGRFDCLASSPGPIGLLQNQMIFGNGEAQDFYLQLHHRSIKGVELHLVTCTQTELTSQEVEKLAQQAIKFAKSQCS